MRSFLALDLPEDVAGLLADIAARLPVGRHVPEDDLHVTLVFLANARLDRLEEIAMTLEMLTPPVLPLRVAGLDIFGSAAPRQIHARIDGGAALGAFQAKTAQIARRAGVDLPHRAFVPHVTLVRFPRQMPPEDHARIGRFLSARADLSLPDFVPPSMTLYQSTLTDDGPRYDVLESYPLV